MTRYTSIGYKRKYLPAGFDNDGQDTKTAEASESSVAGPSKISSDGAVDHENTRSQKKRRRTRGGGSEVVEGEDNLETSKFLENEFVYNDDEDEKGELAPTDSERKGKSKKKAGRIEKPLKKSTSA